jgi:hypothetical protein
MVVPCPQSVESSTQSHNKFGYIPYYIVSYFEIKLCKHISTLPYMNHHIYFLRFIILKCFLKVTIHWGLAHKFTLLLVFIIPWNLHTVFPFFVLMTFKHTKRRTEWISGRNCITKIYSFSYLLLLLLLLMLYFAFCKEKCT